MENLVLGVGVVNGGAKQFPASSSLEVRCTLPPDRIAHVLFCIIGEQMILLRGFIKKSRNPQAGPRLGPAAHERKLPGMNKNNIGSTFDSWLREEGIYDEASSAAIKRVLTRQVEAAMAEQNISKAEMAKRMQTSRAALNRLLDPSHDAVALSTLQKAAIALGRQIRLELI